MAINGFAVIHPGDSASLAHTFQQLLAIPGLVETKQLRICETPLGRVGAGLAPPFGLHRPLLVIMSTYTTRLT